MPTIPELVEQLATALKARDQMMATAESCTGGLIAGACTEISGSSDWFERGFVTYSNAAKSELLGVPAALIAEHGAVSEPVARAMAAGAVANAHAHWSVAVTGVAGPTGGTPEKPVGMVCFGWAGVGGKDGAVVAVTRHFSGDRASVRRQSVICALQGVIERLEYLGKH